MLESLGVGKVGVVAVSWGPIAQSQSPPPRLWSGAPMKVAADPSWLTRMAWHCEPVGPITSDRPNRSLLMLGSAAPLLPGSCRFGLKVAAGGGAALVGAAQPKEDAPSSASTAASTDVQRNEIRMTTSYWTWTLPFSSVPPKLLPSRTRGSWYRCPPARCPWCPSPITAPDSSRRRARRRPPRIRKGGDRRGYPTTSPGLKLVEV